MAKLYSPDDVARMSGDHLYELEDGRLVERMPGVLASYISGTVLVALHNFFGEKHAWIVSIGATFTCFSGRPNTVRRASVAYVAAERLSLEEAKEEHCRVAPDLVAEVLSKFDASLKIDQKIDEWFSAGVKAAWVVDPDKRVVRVHHMEGPIVLFHESDILSCEEVLPGFAYPVAGLFEMVMDKDQKT